MTHVTCIPAPPQPPLLMPCKNGQRASPPAQPVTIGNFFGSRLGAKRNLGTDDTFALCGTALRQHLTSRTHYGCVTLEVTPVFHRQSRLRTFNLAAMRGMDNRRTDETGTILYGSNAVAIICRFPEPLEQTSEICGYTPPARTSHYYIHLIT